MVIKRTFKARCRGCRGLLTLREYEGLEGGLYGESHICSKLDELWRKHPRMRVPIEKIKEVK